MNGVQHSHFWVITFKKNIETQVIPNFLTSVWNWSLLKLENQCLACCRQSYVGQLWNCELALKQHVQRHTTQSLKFLTMKIATLITFRWASQWKMSVTCDMCKVTVQKATSRANCKSLDQTDHISWQNKSLSIRFYVHLYLYTENTNLCFNFFVSNTLEWIKLGHS